MTVALWQQKVRLMKSFRLAELPGHVSAMLLRSLNAGRGIGLFQIFRQPAERNDVRCLCHQDRRVQLHHFRVVHRLDGPAQPVKAKEVIPSQLFQIQRLRQLFRQFIEDEPHLCLMRRSDANADQRSFNLILRGGKV